MNNEQFRRLLFDNPPPSSANKLSPRRDKDGDTSGSTPKAAVLGSRMRSSIPMTPRAVTSANFARQLAEFRRESQPPPAKKFKSSAPKGTRYSGGYVDRTLLRRQAEEGDEDAADRDSRAKRVKALEDMVKLGQIDQATFEKLRGEIGLGGDSSSTHRVKGLDWKLLQRVKAGEDVDVLAAAAPDETHEDDGAGADDEFERVLEEKEKDVVQAAKKEEKVKKGTMAPPPRKMTRDEILKQLKASRAAGTPISLAQEPPALSLGAKFKKIGTSDQKKRWIETDENGRRKEILLVTDSEGKAKRKVRWLDKPDGNKGDLLVVDKDAKPLGMDVPAEVLARANAVEENDDDGDIFEGIGADYNPLADIGDDDSSSASEGETEAEQPLKDKAPRETEQQNEGPTKPSASRNYFATGTTTEIPETTSTSPLSSDPTILAALKRAAAIRRNSPAPEGTEEEEEADEQVILRRKKFLEEARRREREDAMDLDMGFGESRFGDEEDEEVWEERDGGNKRKRGPKKRKGNKDSASDVMKVLEGRKKSAGGT
ncbi:hypothetical protein D8B26_002049 [Coccidioides posadasii str. Silveira]|uniref:uncharacterized protein n=1 Tax=Coccidioides posadasii (strain RMSCC 757 / Silveira) TaxID=443226 RepID=UPI001BF0219F|nr:hypothetical protein D8B26_002049 [Coccidioides posadasii str. Silveira]